MHVVWFPVSGLVTPLIGRGLNCRHTNGAVGDGQPQPRQGLKNIMIRTGNERSLIISGRLADGGTLRFLIQDSSRDACASASICRHGK